MDTITQAVLGAAVGQAGFSKTLGRRANWYGALAGLTPDFDVLARMAGEWQSLVFHRGPTHALWFGPVVGTMLGYATWRYYRRKAQKAPPEKPVEVGPLRAWIGLWVLGLLTHPLLDVFTTYGTQLLSPFSDTRFALNGVGIIDPFYTVPLMIALLIGWRSRANPRRAARAAQIGLVLTCGYLCYGVFQNRIAKAHAATTLSELQVKTTHIEAYPTVLQPWVHRVVARDGNAAYVTYVSTLSLNSLLWSRTPDQVSDPRVKAILRTEKGRIFHWFTAGQIVAFLPTQEGAAVQLDDFRYGIITDPNRGLWGMEARVDAHSLEVTDIRRTRRRAMKPGPVFDALWTTLRGDKASEHSEIRRNLPKGQ